MSEKQQLVSAIFEGWHSYQQVLIEAIRPLNEEQLALYVSTKQRSINEIARHIIGARARWFYGMDAGGDEFKSLGRWDRRGAKARSAAELVSGLERTWQGIQAAINSWSAQDWQQTWPGEDDSEPEIITRQWIIWHLIEHDLHHGGEISLILGAHGIPAVAL